VAATAPIVKIARLHLSILQRLGVAATVTSTIRSRAQQQELHRTRARRKYPVAEPGRSQHEFGAAYDLVAKRPSDQGLVVQVGRELGMVSPTNDPIHFQLYSAADWDRIIRNP
jgi:hypothetical protein